MSVKIHKNKIKSHGRAESIAPFIILPREKCFMAEQNLLLYIYILSRRNVRLYIIVSIDLFSSTVS